MNKKEKIKLFRKAGFDQKMINYFLKNRVNIIECRQSPEYNKRHGEIRDYILKLEKAYKKTKQISSGPYKRNLTFEEGRRALCNEMTKNALESGLEIRVNKIKFLNDDVSKFLKDMDEDEKKSREAMEKDKAPVRGYAYSY